MRDNKHRSWLTQREQFSIGSLIVFIIITIGLFTLVGCTTVIDYPEHIKKEASLQEIKLPELESCVIVYDKVGWVMSVFPMLCKGRVGI